MEKTVDLMKIDFRISRIILKDFRNIKYGEVNLPNGDLDSFMNGEPSVLGLYGQNGSGKTSLLMALKILKTVMSGESLEYTEFESAIREGCEKSSLLFELVGENGGVGEMNLFYSFDLCRSIEDEYGLDNTSKGSLDSADDADYFVSGSLLNVKRMGDPGKFLKTHADNGEHLVIKNEILSFRYTDTEGNDHRKEILIDTTDEACLKSKRAFGNEGKYKVLTAEAPKSVHDALMKYRYICEDRSRSFIFYEKVIKSLIAFSSNDIYVSILFSLYFFAETSLFVIGSAETGLNNMKNLPLMVRINTGYHIATMNVVISLEEWCDVPVENYDATVKAIESLNIVLNKLIPGLFLECVDRGLYTDEKGNEVRRFELLSNRKGVRIPFAYESDGIRRIVSFLSLLISVYNDRAVTVAVDEIDSGIFEYLLGEILTIIGKNARGQLIFTSHNLRPLEVLPSKYLMFTSVDPQKRFVKMSASANNNLRDCYFRSIVLGSDKDVIYDNTDTYEIEQSMIEAGFAFNEEDDENRQEQSSGMDGED